MVAATSVPPDGGGAAVGGAPIKVIPGGRPLRCKARLVNRQTGDQATFRLVSGQKRRAYLAVPGGHAGSCRC